ncbi:Hypothetical_protein [Hexamita inflata]|uniref:Hypothetical_protein n=1 Tax=Hexamita inflata TaxID=28002 RepID=A0AA86QX23_9EUKA|nr:Hypothetical protein HINF_LOCUS52467 [Hexamita inflata]
MPKSINDLFADLQRVVDEQPKFDEDVFMQPTRKKEPKLMVKDFDKSERIRNQNYNLAANLTYYKFQPSQVPSTANSSAHVSDPQVESKSSFNPKSKETVQSKETDSRDSKSSANRQNDQENPKYSKQNNSIQDSKSNQSQKQQQQQTNNINNTQFLFSQNPTTSRPANFALKQFRVDHLNKSAITFENYTQKQNASEPTAKKNFSTVQTLVKENNIILEPKQGGMMHVTNNSDGVQRRIKGGIMQPDVIRKRGDGEFKVRENQIQWFK